MKEPMSESSGSARTGLAEIFGSSSLTAGRAAQNAGEILRSCLRNRGSARILVGTGNSQLEMIRFLTADAAIDWSAIEAFHLDEYVGISANHPSSFRYWIRVNFAEKVHPKRMHYLEGDAASLDRMIEDYARRLAAAPIDLAFVGIGENGHIAFNDPHVADFSDPLAVKRVELDDACRRQQVGEGHFPDLQSVPQEAVTVSCTGLLRATHWICCVPDRRKAKAVKCSLEGPVSTLCPGSLVQTHPSAFVYLDRESASLLTAEFVRACCRVHDSAGLPTATSR